MTPKNEFEGLPIIDVDEGEQFTIAVISDDILAGDVKDPERHPIAIALRRSRGIDDSRVTKNETLVRRASSGFTSLDEQAKALGIHRATAWTIIKNKHKLGRLNRNTVRRILSNHNTPHSVRTIVEQYAAERFDSSGRSNAR